MFIKTPLGKTLFNPELKTATEVINYVCEQERLPINETHQWKLQQNGKFCDLDSVLNPNYGVYVIPTGGLLGGKGGFGSLLRAIGAQIQKTTNHEAMRDLSGRRQRDVNNEQRVRDYAAKQGEREREEREKKEAKMTKLQRLVDRENKHEFSDPAYDKVRSETEEKVHDAMEAAMKAMKENESNGKETELKRKAEPEVKAAPPVKKGLWMGDGLEGLSDEDVTDSEDEDTDEKTALAVKV